MYIHCLQKSRKVVAWNFRPSYAVYNVCYTSVAIIGTRDHPWNNGNTGECSYHRIRITDHWFSDDGNLQMFVMIMIAKHLQTVLQKFGREVPEMQDKVDAANRSEGGRSSLIALAGKCFKKVLIFISDPGRDVGIIGGTGNCNLH